MIGLAAAQIGYGSAAWVLPAAVLLALPLVLLPGRATRVADRAAAECLPLEG